MQMKCNMQMILQWVLEGKEDMKWEKVSPTPGQLASHVYSHSPTEPFEPTSSPLAFHTGSLNQWDLHSVGSRDSLLLPMIYNLGRETRDPMRWFMAETDIIILVFVKYNLESSPEVKSILIEFGIS